MKSKTNHETRTASETFKEMLQTFGNSVGEILDDPEVKEKAKALAESVVDAAAKVGQSKVKNEEMRAKYRNVGKAAQSLGSSLDKHFNNTEEVGC
jgi:hypothetical protein